MTYCTRCGAEIAFEPNAGWVDTHSGDDGGTYDICPGNPDGHEPGKGARAQQRVLSAPRRAAAAA